jgi:DNA uptake protein ComE-like DNA-binding protein
MKEQKGARSADLDLGYVDLNTATDDDLAGIPWIGRKIAEELIRHRPFNTMDDVRRVPGVTEDIMDELVRGGIVVGKPAPLPKR